MDNLEVDQWGEPYGKVTYNGDPCLLATKLRDYRYIRVLRFFLRCVTGWPLQELNEKLLFWEGKYHGYYNTAMAIMFFIQQVWYLMENASSLTFYLLGHMYLTVLITIASTSRGFTLCLSKAYKLLATKFLTEIHLFYHKDQSDYSRYIYCQVHKICSYFTALQTVIFMCAAALFCVVPPFMNYSKGKFNGFNDPVNTTLELAIYFKLPFDPEREFKGYCYSLLINLYATFMCVNSLIMFDTFLAHMVFNLWGHFKVLLHALNTFPKPAASQKGNKKSKLRNLDAMYSEEEEIMITKRLKDAIAYHRMIVEFIDEMSDCFGMVLFVYFTVHQTSGCLLLLECSEGPEALARYLPLTVMMFAQLIQICIIFEIIGTMGEKVKDEVYCLPWDSMNTKNKSIVMIFLINVQIPIHVKAGGLVDVGVTTMAAILKTSISYFVFLNSMSQ